MHGVTKSMFAPGYLYWIQLEESCYVKIGVAIDVRTRLSDLQIGCPFDLKAYHIRGEWFRFPIEMLSANPAHLHKHARLSDLKHEIALLHTRIASLEAENASLKQQLAKTAI